MKPVGDGTRILNFLVDTALIFGIAYAGHEVWIWYVRYWHYPFYSFGWFFAAALLIYYLFFETFFRRTPGKWLSVSRVVKSDGKMPGFFSILIRSLARLTVIDLFFIPFIGKPLHDYLSKTTVVEA